ncbi:hypothetical protein XM50_10755 [Sphingomonas sp. Ag1]|nr:hypothetical protein XM50_10755 [Sphingomonas sp. Ag1]
MAEGRAPHRRAGTAAPPARCSRWPPPHPPQPRQPRQPPPADRAWRHNKPTPSAGRPGSAAWRSTPSRHSCAARWHRPPAARSDSRGPAPPAAARPRHCRAHRRRDTPGTRSPHRHRRRSAPPIARSRRSGRPPSGPPSRTPPATETQGRRAAVAGRVQP